MDVRHRMGIAQVAFGSLSHLLTDHRLTSGDETAAVQTLRVLVPDALLYSLGPHQNGETHAEWL